MKCNKTLKYSTMLLLIPAAHSNPIVDEHSISAQWHYAPVWRAGGGLALSTQVPLIALRRGITLSLLGDASGDFETVRKNVLPLRWSGGLAGTYQLAERQFVGIDTLFNQHRSRLRSWLFGIGGSFNDLQVHLATRLFQYRPKGLDKTSFWDFSCKCDYVAKEAVRLGLRYQVSQKFFTSGEDSTPTKQYCGIAIEAPIQERSLVNSTIVFKLGLRGSKEIEAGIESKIFTFRGLFRNLSADRKPVSLLNLFLGSNRDLIEPNSKLLRREAVIKRFKTMSDDLSKVTESIHLKKIKNADGTPKSVACKHLIEFFDAHSELEKQPLPEIDSKDLCSDKQVFKALKKYVDQLESTGLVAGTKIIASLQNVFENLTFNDHAAVDALATWAHVAMEGTKEILRVIPDGSNDEAKETRKRQFEQDLDQACKLLQEARVNLNRAEQALTEQDRQKLANILAAKPSDQESSTQTSSLSLEAQQYTNAYRTLLNAVPRKEVLGAQQFLAGLYVAAFK